MTISQIRHNAAWIGAVAFVALVGPSPADAAFITWGAATDTTAATDISTNGTLVFARNEGGGAVNVNTVTFSPGTDLAGGTSNALFLNGATPSPTDFANLLNTGRAGGGSGISTIDLGAFMAGATYEVQVFFVDQRTTGGTNDRVMTFGSQIAGPLFGPSTVNLEADPNNANTAPYGQFAIGTFIADGLDPDLTLRPFNGSFGNSHIMALQVRQTAAAPPVPEPSVLALLGLGAATLFLVRRRRKA